MYDKFMAAMEEIEGLEPGSRLGAGVSGGPDSMALVHALMRYCGEKKLELVLLHVEHGIRGEESLSDMRFVEGFCQENGLPLKICRARLGRGPGANLEQEARLARYAFFERTAREMGLKRVALAHQLDDRAETMFLNLIRGCGLSGLYPMAGKDGLYIRPLIGVTRAAIMDYIAQNSINYVVDSTNASLEYSRNRVRERIMPAALAINPGFHGCLSRSMELMRDDDLALNDIARAQYEKLSSEHNGLVRLDSKGVAQLPAALQRRVIRMAVDAVATLTDLERTHVEAVRALLKAQTGKEAGLANGVRARSIYGCVEIFTGQPKNFFEGRAQRIDADKLPEGYVIRNRRAGDYIYPLGMEGKKKLKDYLCERRVPRELRDTLSIYAFESEVFAVKDVGISRKCAITGETKNIIEI